MTIVLLSSQFEHLKSGKTRAEWSGGFCQDLSRQGEYSYQHSVTSRFPSSFLHQTLHQFSLDPTHHQSRKDIAYSLVVEGVTLHRMEGRLPTKGPRSAMI